MEQRKLPNATTSLVLGILSLVLCCFGGILGVILSIIALYLANKDRKLYFENPEDYDNYGQVKTARIIAIIALVLSALFLINFIIGIAQVGGPGAYWDQIQEAIDQAQQARQ